MTTSIAPTETVAQPDGTLTEFTNIPIALPDLPVAHNKVLRQPRLLGLSRLERGTVLSLCCDLFVEAWKQIAFGPCIQGAVFELQLSEPPTTLSYLDGYLTLVLPPGPAHFHLCVGPHQGLKNATPNELARQRQCTRAACVRNLDADGHPVSWAVELWNGADQTMISFFLPSPYLNLQKDKRLKEPAFEHLQLWNDLRRTYLGETVAQPIPAVRGKSACSG